MADGHRADIGLPGRICPPHYGYAPHVFACAPQITADTLYVIGGLYGNPFALDAIDALAAAEPVPPVRVFNGDFHWFDAEPALFARIQQRVLAHQALRGNVETELAADDSAAGCGCAYPESVPDDDVDRSNAILARLRGVAASAVDRSALGALPMHRTAQVGRLRLGIVHGDAWSLAGWRFAHETLHDPDQHERLQSAFELGAVDAFACSHSCAPALAAIGERFVINNGAAGMANFAGDHRGLLTRISVRALPARLARARMYGLHQRGVWIDALAIDFDLGAWLPLFDRIWPPASPAAVSYRARIAAGPAFTIDAALGRAVAGCA